jgi:hypothetical protein
MHVIDELSSRKSKKKKKKRGRSPYLDIGGPQGKEKII